MLVERVIFLQGDSATEYLEKLENIGHWKMLEEMKQCHYPNEHETSNTLGAGTSDRTYTKDNYVLTWNHGLNYIGLEFIKEV